MKDKKTLASWLRYRLGWDSPETLNYTPHVHVVPVVEYLEKGLHTFLSLGPERPPGPGADFPGRDPNGSEKSCHVGNEKAARLPSHHSHPSESSILRSFAHHKYCIISSRAPCSFPRSCLFSSLLSCSFLSCSCLSLPCGPMACTSTACFLYPHRAASCP